MELYAIVHTEYKNTYRVIDKTGKKLIEFSSALDADKAIELVKMVSVEQKDVKKLWEQIEFEVKDLKKRMEMYAKEMDAIMPLSMQGLYNLYDVPSAHRHQYDKASGAYRVSASILARLKTVRDMMFKIYFGDIKAEVIK